VKIENESVGWESRLLDRRGWLKSTASLAVVAEFYGICAALTEMGSPRTGGLNGQKGLTMKTFQSFEPSWLTRQVGFQLAHEQFPVPELVDLGIAADQAGFDLLAVSDHFQPWQANEGHSGQAWVTMSAIGQ
jgi:hypothetical protein